VTVPVFDSEGVLLALDALMDALEGERQREDPVPRMLRAVREHAGDKEVELNPHFTEHRDVHPTDAEWARVRSAAADLRASRQ
jgi:hypothetical protein